MNAILVLIVLGLVVALLLSERVRPDVVAMISLAALVVFRILPPRDAFSGFSNPATITVACMFLLSAGLQASGLVQFVGDRLLEHGPAGEARLLLLIMVVIAPLSAFVNNTAAVAIFLPIVLRVCHGRNLAASRLLMPMAFAAILGGMCTLIGTSTNILVTSLAAERGVRPFRMFEFSHLGLVFLLCGAAYLVLVGRHWLPRGASAAADAGGFRAGGYLAEIVVRHGSPLIGQTLEQSRLAERYDVGLVALGRGKRTLRAFFDDMRLRGGDVVLIKASAENLVRVRKHGELEVRVVGHPSGAELLAAGSALVEAIVYPNSRLVGRTLKSLRFRHRFGATVIAIRRHGAEISEKIGKIPLESGDELLLFTDRAHLLSLKQRPEFVVLHELDIADLDPVKAVTAGLILAGVITFAALGLYPIVFTAFVGCVLMVLSRCLPARRVYRRVDWRIIVLLAGVIPLGAALETSGAAGALVHAALWLAGGESPRALLALFVVATYLLTGFMSNNATAALMAPLAISSAETLGVDSRPFLIGIMFAASAAFYTPVGYQTNLLVYGPGGYRFTDYLRVGGPLNVIFGAMSTLLIPVFFPF